MSKLWQKMLLSLMLVLGGLLSACGADNPADQLPADNHQPVAALLQRGEVRLREIEGYSRAMLTTTLVTQDTNDQWMGVMDDYQDAMQGSYVATHRDAKLAGQSQGKEGDARSVKQFEDTSHDHEQRLQVVQQRASVLAERIRRGEAQLDRAVLARMGEDERLAFHQWLAPTGAAQMQRLHPDLFPQVTLGQRLQHGSHSVMAAMHASCRGLRSPADLLISRAEARIVFSCVGPCVARDWGKCAACVGTSVPEAIRAIDSFKACWKRNTWFFPRLGCIFNLVAVLA